MKHTYLIVALTFASLSLNAMDRKNRVQLFKNKLVTMPVAPLALKKVRQVSNARITIFPFCFAMGYAYLLCNFDRLTTSKGERIGGVDLG